MRTVVVAACIALLCLVAFAPQQLLAAPMSRTVNVAVSPGGTLQRAPGGVGATLPFNYVPARVAVRVGTTVVWTNKSILPEPHTVTFLEPDPRTGEMKGGPPFIVVRPKPGKEGSKNPVDMEFIENSLYLLPSELTGAPFRNSGFLWPARMGPPNAQSSWKHTFGEGDAGNTLRYSCVLHPWMTGTVVVQR